MKKKLLGTLLFFSFLNLFSQKASLTIDKKKLFERVDYKITKNGYVCVLDEDRELKIYEPESLKLHKKYTFEFDVQLKYISDNAEFISLKRYRSTANKLFKAFAGKTKKIKNFYSLIDGEKLKGYNTLGSLEELKKKLDVDGVISNGTFYTGTKHIQICYDKIRNKKINNKKYFIFTTDLVSNTTTYKEFMIDDDVLLPASRSFVNKYKLRKSMRKTTLYISDFNEETFTLMTRSYDKYTKKTKYPTIQKTQLLKYDFSGKLLMNNILKNNIDSKMEFVDVNSRLFPVDSYDMKVSTHTTATGGSITSVKYIATEVSLGYFYNPENTNEYYTYSLLKGIKSKDGAQIVVSKFDENGAQKWTKNIVISNKRLKFDVDGFRSQLDMSHYNNTLSISISNNKDDLFRAFHINTETGEVSEPHNFEKIKYDSSLATRYYASHVKIKSISKKNVFSEQTLRFYFLNMNFKKFIDNLNTNKKYSLSTVELNDNIYLQVFRKDQLRIFKF